MTCAFTAARTETELTPRIGEFDLEIIGEDEGDEDEEDEDEGRQWTGDEVLAAAIAEGIGFADAAATGLPELLVMRERATRVPVRELDGEDGEVVLSSNC